MITIHLNNLTFYAHHGIHEEESIVGAAFELNVSVSFQEEGKITSLEQTVDYVSMYNTIRDHMIKPSRLLETLAMQVADQLHANDNRIRTININIRKLNPPINNFTGTVGLTYTKDYSA